MTILIEDTNGNELMSIKISGTILEVNNCEIADEVAPGVIRLQQID